METNQESVCCRCGVAKDYSQESQAKNVVEEHFKCSKWTNKRFVIFKNKTKQEELRRWLSWQLAGHTSMKIWVRPSTPTHIKPRCVPMIPALGRQSLAESAKSRVGEKPCLKNQRKQLLRSNTWSWCLASTHMHTCAWTQYTNTTVPRTGSSPSKGKLTKTENERETALCIKQNAEKRELDPEKCELDVGCSVSTWKKEANWGQHSLWCL